MGYLYVFMGKSASGKDTIYREIMKRNSWLHPVVPYTTRPIRQGEREGREYHFVTLEQLRRSQAEGNVVECRCYETVNGPWYYYTAEDGQVDFSCGDYAMISTLEGFEKIRAFYGEGKVKPIYIEVEDMTRIQRALKREKQQRKPCVAEVCRRFLADEEDFSEKRLQELQISRRFENDTLDEAIFQIEQSLKNGR